MFTGQWPKYFLLLTFLPLHWRESIPPINSTILIIAVSVIPNKLLWLCFVMRWLKKGKSTLVPYSHTLLKDTSTTCHSNKFISLSPHSDTTAIRWVLTWCKYAVTVIPTNHLPQSLEHLCLHQGVERRHLKCVPAENGGSPVTLVWSGGKEREKWGEGERLTCWCLWQLSPVVPSSPRDLYRQTAGYRTSGDLSNKRNKGVLNSKCTHKETYNYTLDYGNQLAIALYFIRPFESIFIASSYDCNLPLLADANKVVFKKLNLS